MYRYCLAALISAIFAYAEAPDSADVLRAKASYETLRGLVASGAIAPVRLQEAELAIADARDDGELRSTLYGTLTVAELSDAQSESMVAAAQRRFDRQKARVERVTKLVEAGVLARGEIASLEAELASRQLTLNLAQSRANLLHDLKEMILAEAALRDAHSSDTSPAILPVVERFDGGGVFTPGDLKKVTLAYEKQFDRPIPLSAVGETDVHRSLGFDHRGRVDVALNPDQPEGQWLRQYLTSREIPFYAFRSAVRGKATAAHIHIGPGSTRLHAGD